MNLAMINGLIQDRLRATDADEVTAVEAAAWLHTAGLLRDNPDRRGLPLRNLLRAGAIVGAEQRPSRKYGRWFIKMLRV